MPTHAAFLRAINLPGRRITNAELRTLFEAMGVAEVALFRASGNVVFTADDEPVETLAERIEQSLLDSLGYEVTTFLRSADELHAIAEHQPFDAAMVNASKGKLQVALLPEAPSQHDRKQVLALASEGDQLAFGERELYWLPSGGTMQSALDRDAVDALIGPTTHRTKSTLEQITRKFFAG